METITFLKKVSLSATACRTFLRAKNLPPQSYDFFSCYLNKCLHVTQGYHWPILIKFEIQALFELLFNISRKLAGTSFKNTRSLQSKLCKYFDIRMVVTYHFSRLFFSSYSHLPVKNIFLSVIWHKFTHIAKKISLYWYVSRVPRGKKRENRTTTFERPDGAQVRFLLVAPATMSYFMIVFFLEECVTKNFLRFIWRISTHE